MNIQITGRHLDITDKLNTYINEKFEKLARHFDHITQCHILMGKDSPDFTAEAELHIPGENVFAKSHASTAYEAIDLLVSKLDRQVLKHKEKMKAHNADRIDFRDAEEAAG